MSVIVGGEFNLSADSRSLPLKELASILAAKGRVLRNFPDCAAAGRECA